MDSTELGIWSGRRTVPDSNRVHGATRPICSSYIQEHDARSSSYPQNPHRRPVSLSTDQSARVPHSPTCHYIVYHRTCHRKAGDGSQDQQAGIPTDGFLQVKQIPAPRFLLSFGRLWLGARPTCRSLGRISQESETSQAWALRSRGMCRCHWPAGIVV